ncbi:hypothetical protein WA556_002251 [Blastocystis sp. ATCC 50177/Nand II]
MVSKQPYTPYQMEFTMLSDFSEDDLDEVMDVEQKHSGRGSYYEPIEAKEEAVEPAFTTMDRDFCSEDAELREYAKPNDCSLSWVTMIVNAGERALAMIGGSEKLSAAFVKECYTEGDACNGLGMADIAEGLKKIGLVTEREANRVLEEGGNLCSIPQSKHFTFKVLKAEGPNRGGLMNLIGEGNPVLTLLSINLNRLRFVKDMREEDVTLSGTVYEPSLYGLVTGYVKTTEEVDGYWVVEGTPSPCESVNVKVPMRDNETNSDYAGIAGYAFAIEFNGKRDFVVPSEGLTSVDAIPSFAQSIVFAADSFSELSEVDFSRFRELKELVFGANSFANVGSLELVGLHKLERLRFEVGAFANGFNLVLSDLPSLVDLVYSAGCFNGKPPGRRLADVSGYGIRISGCSSLRRVTIPGGSFTHATAVSMVSLSAVEEVTIEEGALPSVEVLNMMEIQNVTRISIAPGSLEVCETLVMVDVAIKAENVTDVLNITRDCLKELKKVMVNSVDSMLELVEDLKEKLEKEVEVEVIVPTTAVPTVTPTTVTPTTNPPTTVTPTTNPPTTVTPTTNPPTTVTPTTLPPTTSVPTTIPPTPTSEPWFPIYDPYILGDNCNFEKQTTCYWDVVKDDNVTRLYLSVRDAYPTKALAHTRVLALSGMTSMSLELFHESLSKQMKNEAPIDTYFYSDVLLSRGLDVALIPRLMELLQYTYPSRLVFVYGTFKREGFKTMLDWMVANANSTYFKNLKYFQVSEHNIQSCVNPEDAATLQAAILSDLKTICEDKVHFPLLETINLDNNGYNEGGGTGISEFAMQLMQACPATTNVTVSAWTHLDVHYTKMCGSVNDSYVYYDLNDERERAQCRYTWNWELKSGEREYAANGPFPNSESLQYCNTPTTLPPTTLPPTTSVPTTIPPTPTSEPWFPIYDPYILGDNCNFEKQTTCYWDVVKDDNVTRLYLSVRDAYPTKALAHTRVLALSGMTSMSLELFHESLSKQMKNEAPIDTYFYSDVLLSRGLDVALIPRLMELLQYTYPSRLVFVYGTFKREGFKTMLDWMVANANSTYFKNLKYFQVSEHNIQSCVNPEDAATLQAAILSDLKTICEDKVHFPLLETINLDNNGYNEGGGTGISEFAMQLMQACPATTNVTVSAWTHLDVHYTKMCGSVNDSYVYYDLNDERERAQCRYSWNWELKSGEREYAANGPFPNSESLQYCNTPTTLPPTTSVPTTIPPTPTSEPWFPIYDPYILGDNCNFEKQTTCYWDVIKDDNVTRLYLSVRDAYPTKALAHTRVLALSGMTSMSLELFHESLSKQMKNEAPIDTYFYSDVLLSRGLDVALIPRLMELLQYTYPSRLVFVYGTFKREGFKTMLDWMVANANSTYFKNLKYFQVSEHNIQASVNVGDAETLEAAILSDLKAICEDKVHFPLLETINLDSNGYNEGGGTGISLFAQHLMGACPATTNVTVSAWTHLDVHYTKMCGSVNDSYVYYDLNDERERAQCRYTWNWELKSGEREYAANGPFPNRGNLQYCDSE